MKKLIAAAVLCSCGRPERAGTGRPAAMGSAHGKRAKDRGMYDSYGRYYEPRRLRAATASGVRTTVATIVDATMAPPASSSAVLSGPSSAVNSMAGVIARSVRSIGAAGGALLGRAIDRGELKCRVI